MGYQFSHKYTEDCPACDGTGSVEQTIDISVDNSDTRVERALAWVRQHIPPITVTSQCSNCGGTGTCSETRPLTIDELSDRQIRFLHTARAEREEAKWGDNSSGSGGMNQHQPNVSRPSPTGPPIQGGHKPP